MKNYKILFILLFVIGFAIANAQDSDKMTDKGRIALTVWVPDNIDGMPAAAITNLENKLHQIAVANGLSGDAHYSRFVLAANVNVMTKDVTATAPPMQAYTLNVTLYIGDGFEGKAFSSYSTTCKGVGENETKAYLNALKNLKTNNPAYQSFVDKGKSKIIAYYNAQCDYIIKNAKVLAGMNKFDEAIYNLTSVPDACPDCWNKSMDAVAPIFKEKIDFECKAKMNQATNVWNADQSWNGAQRAGKILSSIDPNSECFEESKTLGNKIAARIKEVDKREWEFVYDYEIGLKRDMIKAYRDVGVAWGNGQQPTTIIYKSFW